MQMLEQVAKIISYLMTLTAIPTLAITIGRYYYDKRKTGVEERIKSGYLPLYEYFYYEDNIEEFRKKTNIVAYTRTETFYEVIDNKVDKLVLPLKLATLIMQYEVLIDIASTGIVYLNTRKNCSDEEEYIDRVNEFLDEISSEIAISMDEEIEDEEIEDENFPEEYIYMIESALERAKIIERKIRIFVTKKIKTEYKYRY